MRRVGIRYEDCCVGRFFLNVEPPGPWTDKPNGEVIDLPDEVVARYLAVIERFDEVQEELEDWWRVAEDRRVGRLREGK